MEFGSELVFVPATAAELAAEEAVEVERFGRGEELFALQGEVLEIAA